MAEANARDALLRSLTETLEADAPVTPETRLADVGSWDSLAVVVTIAAIDDACGRQVDGKALSECETAADVLRLAGWE